jgi:hypothetical protein
VPALPQAQLLIWSLTAAAAPGLTIALRLGPAYIHAWQISRPHLFDAICETGCSM